MREIININKNWEFILPNSNEKIKVDLPHTWNNIDGQDGGDDYLRGIGKYFYHLKNTFSKNKEVYLEINGANSNAKVFFNSVLLQEHKGGYSKFRVNLTKHLKDDNELMIEVDNSYFEDVYPQKADFTFYGGLYRDVNLIIVDKDHFDLDYYGSQGIKAISYRKDNKWHLMVNAYTCSDKEVKITILDANDKAFKTFKNNEDIVLEKVHLWDGLNDPYLYKIKAQLLDKNTVLDEITIRHGFRTFYIDSKKGFFLNGKSYPLRGVSRHQDYLNLGNALTKAEHENDIKIIKEIGANTIRLAHYQHDDYFYDLCDQEGFIIWAEIPFISQYLPKGDENAISQMKELIYQEYNHPSIVTWGIANEITMFRNNKKEKIALLKTLNQLTHDIDPTRLTTLACFAMCSFSNKTSLITDIVSWNLYLGWYVPGLFLNDLWFKFYHLLHPNRALGLSEYGAEGMPTLHSLKPKRFDNSEEYQCKYHEYLLKCFERHPYLWGTHVWNMFDFGSDGRNQGDDPGKNHKGLVTFDRKLKKDAFYLYKAYWSKEEFIHLCSRRYVNRHEKNTIIKIYANSPRSIKVYLNDKLLTEYQNQKVFSLKATLKDGENIVKIDDGVFQDEMKLNKVDKRDDSYLVKSGNSYSWEKKSD